MDVRLNVNGFDVNAHFDDESVHSVLLPLLRELTQRQKKANRRLVALLAAPPGAGKSTLLSFLEALCREREELREIQTIGMDGFHRRQEYLQSHFVARGGRRVSMVEIKGAPVTFDLERLTASVREVASGAVCGWPTYYRLLHNPVEDAIRIDGDIVLLEGNYLLLDEDGWRDLSALADYTIFVRADEAMLRDRLIDRRIKGGTAREPAVRFVDFSDMPNVRLCLDKTMPADARLTIDADGDYHMERIG